MRVQLLFSSITVSFLMSACGNGSDDMVSYRNVNIAELTKPTGFTMTKGASSSSYLLSFGSAKMTAYQIGSNDKIAGFATYDYSISGDSLIFMSNSYRYAVKAQLYDNVGYVYLLLSGGNYPRYIVEGNYMSITK